MLQLEWLEFDADIFNIIAGQLFDEDLACYLRIPNRLSLDGKRRPRP